MTGVQHSSTIVLDHPVVRMLTVVISTHISWPHSSSTPLLISVHLSIDWFTRSHLAEALFEGMAPVLILVLMLGRHVLTGRVHSSSSSGTVQ